MRNDPWAARQDALAKLAGLPPPSRKLRIYLASCLHHIEIAKGLVKHWPEFNWTMHWPEMIGKFNEHPGAASEFWRLDIADIAMSDVVMIYAQSDDVLRGALVEVGAGIALGTRVIAVGENELFGTWQFHPTVARAQDLAEAWSLLWIMAAG